MGILIYKGVNYSGGASYDDTGIRELLNQKIDKNKIGEGLEFDENNNLKIVDDYVSTNTYSKDEIDYIINNELPIASEVQTGGVKSGTVIQVNDDGTMDISTILSEDIYNIF